MAKTRKSVSARQAKPQKVTANRKPAAVTINSHRDLQIHYESVMAQQKTRGDKLAALLTTNIGATDLIRTEFLRFLLDGPRDIDAECGYPAFLTPEHYRAMYDREGAAKRVVECFPEETWAMDPEVYEDEDPQTETVFEAAWGDLLKKHNIWSYLKRFDILSGIGQYGILLLGVDDGKDMRDPVDNLNDDGTWDPPPKQCNLLYMRPFSEEVVFVKTRETDTNSPRYGLPTRYTIQFRDFPNWGIQAGEIIARDVHWTRVIHFADNKKQSEIYGLPRMQQVYNRLYDLRKIYACAGEAYWKGGFPGLVFEVNPELADQGLTLDTDTLRKEFENYQAGLQRYLAVTGVTTKSLPPQFVDPTGPAEANLKAIAVALNIPYRKLFGTEESKLAGDQDDRAWNKRVASRQTHTVNPLIIRPLVDRFIALGVLPPPESGEYEVEWPDLNSPTDQDKAGVALTRTQAMQGYILGNVSQLVPPDVYLEKELGYTPDEIANIAEAAQEQAAMEETPEAMDEEQEEQGEGQENENDNEGDLAASSVPDQGNALLQKDLDGSTTIPPKGKRVDATFVEQPDLNSSGLKTNTWSDAAREASIEVREAEAKGKTTEDEDKEGVDDGDGSDAEDKGIISKFDSMYPRAGAVIEGRKVTSKVPNTDSIASTLDDYHVLPGIRDFPIYDAKGEGFGGINSYYAADDQRRVKGLMEKLKTSGKIAPLIIVQAKDGPYVLEGGHRMSALVELGAKRVPAMVVLDLEDLRGGDEPTRNTSGKKIKKSQASRRPTTNRDKAPKRRRAA